MHSARSGTALGGAGRGGAAIFEILISNYDHGQAVRRADDVRPVKRSQRIDPLGSPLFSNALAEGSVTSAEAEGERATWSQRRGRLEPVFGPGSAAHAHARNDVFWFGLKIYGLTHRKLALPEFAGSTPCGVARDSWGHPDPDYFLYLWWVTWCAGARLPATTPKAVRRGPKNASFRGLSSVSQSRFPLFANFFFTSMPSPMARLANHILGWPPRLLRNEPAEPVGAGAAGTRGPPRPAPPRTRTGPIPDTAPARRLTQTRPYSRLCA